MGAPYNQTDARQTSHIVAPIVALGTILSRSEREVRRGWRGWSVLVHWRCSGAREREPRRLGGTAEVRPGSKVRVANAEEEQCERASYRVVPVWRS